MFRLVRGHYSVPAANLLWLCGGLCCWLWSPAALGVSAAAVTVTVNMDASLFNTLSDIVFAILALSTGFLMSTSARTGILRQLLVQGRLRVNNLGFDLASPPTWIFPSQFKALPVALVVAALSTFFVGFASQPLADAGFEFSLEAVASSNRFLATFSGASANQTTMRTSAIFDEWFIDYSAFKIGYGAPYRLVAARHAFAQQVAAGISPALYNMDPDDIHEKDVFPSPRPGSGSVKGVGTIRYPRLQRDTDVLSRLLVTPAYCPEPGVTYEESVSESFVTGGAATARKVIQVETDGCLLGQAEDLQQVQGSGGPGGVEALLILELAAPFDEGMSPYFPFSSDGFDVFIPSTEDRLLPSFRDVPVHGRRVEAFPLLRYYDFWDLQFSSAVVQPIRDLVKVTGPNAAIDLAREYSYIGFLTDDSCDELWSLQKVQHNTPQNIICAAEVVMNCDPFPEDSSTFLQNYDSQTITTTAPVCKIDESSQAAAVVLRGASATPVDLARIASYLSRRRRSGGLMPEKSLSFGHAVLAAYTISPTYDPAKVFTGRVVPSLRALYFVGLCMSIFLLIFVAGFAWIYNDQQQKLPVPTSVMEGIHVGAKEASKLPPQLGPMTTVASDFEGYYYGLEQVGRKQQATLDVTITRKPRAL